MALYSVWDWSAGDYRVYESTRDHGLYDPPARAVAGDPRSGAAVEDALVELPSDARYQRRSAVALGRVAMDAQARRQATAALPAGVGALSGMGQMPDDLELPSEHHPGLQWGPVIITTVAALLLWDLLAHTPAVSNPLGELRRRFFRSKRARRAVRRGQPPPALARRYLHMWRHGIPTETGQPIRSQQQALAIAYSQMRRATRP
jgi:hypothetical protein